MERNRHMDPLSEPKAISVAMASYNGALFLEQQIRSILAQSLQPVDIFVSDDRSEDDTPVILRKFSSNNQHIRFCVNQNRLGVIENFKQAVSLCADADFTAISDQDDSWMPHKLETLSAKLSLIDNGTDPAMVYSDLVLTDVTGDVVNNSFWNELGHDWYKHCLPTLLFGNFVTGCTILMNRKLREHFAVMPADVVMHDAWLALIAFSFGKAEAVSEPLVQYRRHESNVSAVSSYRKKGRIDKWIEHIRQLLQNDYLSEQFELLTKFLSVYQNKLSEEQKKTIHDFLQLEQASYLQKKKYMRAVFKKYRF